MSASAAEILRYIASREPLALSASRFGLSREALAELVRTAAAQLEGSTPAAPPEAPALEPPAPVLRDGRAARAPAGPPPDVSPADGAQGQEPGAAHARVKVYSDGASRGNPGLAGAGAVLIDPDSGRVIERLKLFLGQQTNNVAEYEGVLLGLRRAQELGVREVEVVADSQLMIRQLGGQYKVKNAGLKPLYDAAVRLLKSFDRVRLVHVPREMNTLADEMSNRAIDER